MVDLGAQWIHGEKGNVVYEMVAPLNITDHSVPNLPEVYTSTGELIDRTLSNNLTDTYFDLLYMEGKPDGDKCENSVGECFEDKYEFRT